MTDGLTVDEALRALAALEAAWKDDEEALSALAAGSVEEQPLPALVAAYGEHAMDTLMALAFGLRSTMSDEELAEISDAVSSNIGARMSALLTQTLKTWGTLAAPDDHTVTKIIAHTVIDAMRAVTEDPSKTEVLPLLATFRSYALNGT
ncbi:hypothetical protein GCM10018790_49730 [Kitasatospora xanthocidica]|uniref:hypothetical protein n=1 Tax=Kitasatospora xanthocidica TaxID=83382 RepID=UPI00167504F0|nr:hypothetical protein [Kitasatospora xanthocidica]GHF65958.1 hypothetical protein GCM10018790_49730 [Kitasatospora xanthocidica]